MTSIRTAVVALPAVSLALAACASSPSVQTGDDFALNATGGISDTIPDRPFYDWLDRDLARKIRANAAYKRIPMDNSPQRDVFIGWLHPVYRQKISPDQFRQRVLAGYPGSEYEVGFIVSSLPPVSQRPAPY